MTDPFPFIIVAVGLAWSVVMAGFVWLVFQAGRWIDDRHRRRWGGRK